MLFDLRILSVSIHLHANRVVFVWSFDVERDVPSLSSPRRPVRRWPPMPHRILLFLHEGLCKGLPQGADAPTIRPGQGRHVTCGGNPFANENGCHAAGLQRGIVPVRHTHLFCKAAPSSAIVWSGRQRLTTERGQGVLVNRTVHDCAALQASRATLAIPLRGIPAGPSRPSAAAPCRSTSHTYQRRRGPSVKETHVADR